MENKLRIEKKDKEIVIHSKDELVKLLFSYDYSKKDFDIEKSEALDSLFNEIVNGEASLCDRGGMLIKKVDFLNIDIQTEDSEQNIFFLRKKDISIEDIRNNKKSFYKKILQNQKIDMDSALEFVKEITKTEDFKEIKYYGASFGTQMDKDFHQILLEKKYEKFLFFISWEKMHSLEENGFVWEEFK